MALFETTRKNYTSGPLSYLFVTLWPFIYIYIYIYIYKSRENDIKKSSAQLSCNPTLIFCQLLIYIIKKRNNYIETRRS